MPAPLTRNDFNLFRVVCEIRYENAYLIYDRTGAIAQQLRGRFDDFEQINAAPTQSSFRSKEGSLTFELGQARIVTEKPESGLETFAANCKKFFSVVTALLEVRVLTRIGFRQLYRHATPSQDEALDALQRVRFLQHAPAVNLGHNEPMNEVVLRWQGDNVGSVVRIGTQSAKMNIVLPGEFQEENRELSKEISGLTYDVDYYTVAPVEVSQWDAVSWIPDRARAMRKNMDTVLGE